MPEPATIHKLVDLLKQRDDINLDQVLLAYEFAEEIHSGQMRRSGEPSIVHSLETAKLLAELHMDEATIIAGLLHDIGKYSPDALVTVREHFGTDVYEIISGVTKLAMLKYRGVERYIENLRRMFVAIAKDIRVIIVKFADRIHDLETMDALSEDKRRRIALESLEIYAPIANRLGIGSLKGRIEDLAFRHADPENYRRTTEQMEQRIKSSDEVLKKIITSAQDILSSEGISVHSIHGRAKHIYSLYRKLLRKKQNFDEIHDLVAVRIIVDNIHDCYAALGILHDHWRPVKGYIKDYIAVPKANGYQSLHTTVFCDEGNVVEFQIRTEKMHYDAEYGVAAHWKYVEAGKPKDGATISKHKIQWLNHLMQLHKEIQDGQSYLQHAKLDLFDHHIFIFTPQGDIVDLPEGATVIDFAYRVHTNVGNSCVGAKINDKIASLDTRLNSGDLVEILINKLRTAPNPEWLQFARTHTAKSHIRAALHKARQNALMKTAG